MKKILYLFPVLLLLAGCQSSTTTQEVVNPVESQEAPGTTTQKNAPKSFETLEEIQSFISSEDAKSYIVEKPDGFEAYRYQPDAEPYNFGLDGVSQNIYLLTDLNSGQYDGFNRDTTYPFFVETTTPPNCQTQEGCDESATVTTYYGPFEGELMNIFE